MNASTAQFLAGAQWSRIDTGYFQEVGAMLAALKTKLVTRTPLQAEKAAELDALLPAFLDRACKGEL